MDMVYDDGSIVNGGTSGLPPRNPYTHSQLQKPNRAYFTNNLGASMVDRASVFNTGVILNDRY